MCDALKVIVVGDPLDPGKKRLLQKWLATADARQV
jgi:hypothetical protein